MNTWLLIAAAAGAFLLFRRSRSKGAASAEVDQAGAVQVPAGANIGRIGATIENPAALQDFAAALEAQSAPRVISTEVLQANRHRLTWSDGRVTIQTSAGVIVSDIPFYAP